MEETVQQEKPESEYKVQNEDEGGIRRRLRDRDLLRKRKAEAEEKETYQWVIGVESQRKRPRAEQRSGSKKRGRPRKSEPTPEISFTQGETALAQDTPAVVVVPEPMGVIPAQTSGSLIPLLAMGSDTFELPTSVLAAPAPMPVFGSVQNPLFTPTLTSPAPAPVNTTPALVSPSVFAPSPAKVLDKAPVPAQDSSPAPDAVPVPALSQAPVPAVAPPTAQVETLYAESKGKEALDQVLIEDLGPDEEEDISSTQDKRADEDLNESPLINVPEQNKTSIPTLSSPLPPQEYLPGN